MSKIYKVLFASVAIAESAPPQLFLFALGSTRTGGWTNPRFNPHVYITPPADGIYDFDFEADAPHGPASEALAPITTSELFPEVPAGCKGVRIHAEEGAFEALLVPSASFAFPDAMFLGSASGRTVLP